MEIRNAQITDVKLYIEDHDILTFDIFLKLSCGCCALGGYALDQAFRVNESEDKREYERKASPAGLECMRKIMEVVGVKSWEDLVGKYIRYEDNGWGSSVTKIGNILKNDWIDVKDFMTNYDYNDWIKKYKPTNNTLTDSSNKYKVGDIFDFELTTDEKVQALAVKEVGEDMLFILYDCLDKEYTMNEILINGVLDKIYETFPSDIKSLMKPFESGYLRLPTEKEIFGCNEYGEDEGDEAEQFEPMKLRRNRIASQGLNGNYEWWWLANKTVASGSYFAYVNSRGASDGNNASCAIGVRPLFLIKNLKKY